METCTTQTQDFAPTNSEVVNITGCYNKGLTYGVEGDDGLQQVNSNSGRCINGKDWTGVHSSLEVLSLDKQHGMKGKQITAGQLTGTEQGITMQLLARKIL